jgi:hypothetical protein
MENALRTNAWRKTAASRVERAQRHGLKYNLKHVHLLGTDLASFVHAAADKFIAL